MTRMLIEVKINSVDVSSYVASWICDESFGDFVRECKILLQKDVSDAVDISNGQTITIKRGLTAATDQWVFNGYVDRIEREGGAVVVKGKDRMVELIRASVNYSYDSNIDASAGVGSAIVTNLIETYTGLTSSVVNTGSLITLNKFICRNADVFERCKRIADIYDYMLYYDPDDDKIHFEPKGYTTSTDVIYIDPNDATKTNVSRPIEWKYDETSMCNALTVVGAEQEVEETQTFDGDGAADQTNTLTYKPIRVVASVAGTVKTPGVSGSTSGSYDYEIDKENKQINWNQSYDPPVGVGNISITYTRGMPIPVYVEDEPSIAAHVSGDFDGKFEKQITLMDIQTVSDAERFGNAYLSKYATEFVSATIYVDTDTKDYEAGQKVRVVDVQQGEDKILVISKIEKRFPHRGDKISAGDRTYRLADWGMNIAERIRRLEEESKTDQDFLITIKQLPHVLPIRKRYLQVLSKSINDATMMIWNHPSQGTWNSYKWGTNAFGSETQKRLVWQDQKVIEDFEDTDFKAAATTCTWAGAGAGTATFTNGELAVSEIVYDNAVNITKATLTADSTTNLTFEMRVDGTNWESCTSGTEHTFANTGQELEWRATASGNATLTEITIEVVE